MAIWVKICGITRLEDAQAAFASGADAIGINFWSPSKRYCRPEDAREIVAALPGGSPVFGVFVNATRQEIERIADEVGLTGIQFHGDEQQSEAEGWSLAVIRAVPATSRPSLAAAIELGEACATAAGPGHSLEKIGKEGRPRDYRVLVDHASGGGSGKQVDSGILEGVHLSSAILAGGLTPDNVAASVRRYRPFGVDTAGGVESSPGVKDAAAIEAFVRAARTSRAD